MPCPFSAAEADRVIVGPQPVSTNYFTGLPPLYSILAADGTWTGEFNVLNKITGEDVNWCGGQIVGTFPAATSWDRMHNAYAFSVVDSYNAVLQRIRIHNTGDAISLKGASDQWILYGIHATFARDDAFQNDFGCDGFLDDCLFDGVYSGFSSRPYTATIPDNSHKVVHIENTLCRLGTMPTTYGNRGPGHGKFFKMDNANQAGWPGHHRDPKLALRDNVFRLDTPHTTNTDFMIPPPERCVESVNNVMVWGGAGPFPYPVYPGWTVTADLSVWDNARADWLTRHAETAQVYPNPE